MASFTKITGIKFVELVSISRYIYIIRATLDFVETAYIKLGQLVTLIFHSYLLNLQKYSSQLAYRSIPRSLNNLTPSCEI